MVNPLAFPILKQSMQGFGRNLTKDCKKCGSDRFDSILDYLFKKDNNLCHHCRTQAKIFKFVMLRWLSFNKTDSQTLYNLSANTVIRKVLKNIFKGRPTRSSTKSSDSSAWSSVEGATMAIVDSAPSGARRTGTRSVLEPITSTEIVGFGLASSGNGGGGRRSSRRYA